MWVFGHLGFGSKIAEPVAKRLPFGWLLLGTVLPDLIDKPLYYGASFLTGRWGADIGLISCTRTFGHTALFALFLTTLAIFRKSKPLAAVAIGVATHLALDGFEDYWIHTISGESGESSSVVAMLFPFYLHRFSAQPFPTMFEHIKTLGRPFLIVSEIIGLGILSWTLYRDRRRLKLADRIGSILKKSKAVR